MTATLSEANAPPVGPVQRGTMHALNGEGDSVFSWNPGVEDEIAAAREHFARLRGMGHLMYKVVGHEQGEQIHDFEPDAQRIMAIRPPQGG